MDLFFEKSSTLEEKMFNKPDTVPLEDPENYVYQIPGLDAHGNLPAFCSNFYLLIVLGKKIRKLLSGAMDNVEKSLREH